MTALERLALLVVLAFAPAGCGSSPARVSSGTATKPAVKTRRAAPAARPRTYSSWPLARRLLRPPRPAITAFVDAKAHRVRLVVPSWVNRSSFGDGMMYSRFGYVDLRGRVLAAPALVGHEAFRQGLAPVAVTKGRWQYLDKRGRLVGSETFDKARGHSEGLAVVERKGRCGYVDREAKIVIRLGFKRCRAFEGGFAAVSRDGKRFGFIDKAGKLVIPARYYDTKPFAQGFAAVKLSKRRDRSWTFIDARGKRITRARCYTTYPFTATKPALCSVTRQRVGADDHAEGILHYTWVRIDRRGRTKKAPDVPSSEDADVRPNRKYANYGRRRLCAGRTVAKVKGPGDLGGLEHRRLDCEPRWGEKRFRETVRYPYDKAREVTTFSEGLAGARVGKRWGFIDTQGKWVIKPSLQEVGLFFDGLARARKGKLWGFIDKRGAWRIEPKFHYVEPFAGGRALVWHRGLFGFIDDSGKRVIEPRFIDAGYFIRGLAPARAPNGRWGYIDRRGRWRHEPTLAHATVLSAGGLGVVRQGKRWGIFSANKSRQRRPTSGKAIRWLQSRDVSLVGEFSEGLAPALRGYSFRGKWGYIDARGRTVIKPQFAAAMRFSGGRAWVFTKDRKAVVIDTKGKPFKTWRRVGSYTRVEPFSGKFARSTGGFFQLMLIDRSGGWVTQAKWISPLSSGRIVVLAGKGRCTKGECDFRIADATGRVVALEPAPRRPKRHPVGSSVFELR